MPNEFVVVHKGKYLISTPDWNGGRWTNDPLGATVYSEVEFFQQFYPQFERQPATTDQILSYEERTSWQRNAAARRSQISRERYNQFMRRINK